MTLDHRRAVEIGSGAGTARDRLVILILIVAEREVRHRAVGARHHTECAVEAIGDRLRSLDVAGDHSRRIHGRQHRTRRDHDPDRLQAAGVHRDLVVDQRPEHIKHRRLRDARRRVVVGGPHVAGAGEIDDRFALRVVDGDLHVDHAAVVHVHGECAVRKLVDHAPHRFLGVVLYVLHVRVDDLEPEVPDHLRELGSALRTGGDLRAHIGKVRLGAARRIARGREQRADFVLEKAPGGNELDVVEQHALLVDVRRVRRHRPRRDAADVRMMAARRNKERRLVPLSQRERG